MYERLEHTESYCDVLFDTATGDVERKWGPSLKASNHHKKNKDKDRWLRGDDDPFFSAAGGEPFWDGSRSFSGNCSPIYEGSMR